MKNTIMSIILVVVILCGIGAAEINTSTNNTSNDVLVREIINQTSIHVYNKTSDQLINDTVNDSKAYVINQTAIALTNKTSAELANQTTRERIDTASLVLTNKTANQLASDAANDTKNATMAQLNDTKNATMAELNNQSANLQNYSQEQAQNATLQITDNGKRSFFSGLIDMLTGWGRQFCMYLRN